MRRRERFPGRIDRDSGRARAVPPHARGRRPWVRRGAAFLPVLALLGWVACGCAKVNTVSETVYSGDGIKIRLVEKVEKDGGEPVPRGFEQPWDASLGELDALLGSILYQQTVMFFHGKKRHAFPVEKRLEMLKPLQEAFAKATPNQVVDFSFTNRKKWLVVTRDTLTDGVLFRKDGKLNCAFRNLAFEDMADPEGSGEPFRGDPTEEPVRTSWVLSVGPGQDLFENKSAGLFGSRKFPNWIRLDLSGKWDRPGDEAVAASGEPAGGGEPAEEAEPTSRQEIQKRLDFLEELHKEGSIAEESYQKKKKDLLDLLSKTDAPAGAAH